MSTDFELPPYFRRRAEECGINYSDMLAAVEKKQQPHDGARPFSDAEQALIRWHDEADQAFKATDEGQAHYAKYDAACFADLESRANGTDFDLPPYFRRRAEECGIDYAAMLAAWKKNQQPDDGSFQLSEADRSLVLWYYETDADFKSTQEGHAYYAQALRNLKERISANSPAIGRIDAASFEELVINCNKPVLVDFYAYWCVPCRENMPVLNQLAEEIRDEVPVYKVDYEDEKLLAERFCVTVFPTLMLFYSVDGGLRAHRVGIGSIEEMREWVAPLRQEHRTNVAYWEEQAKIAEKAVPA